MPHKIPHEVVDHFASIPLFRHVSERGLRALVAAADEIEVRPGTNIVREGEHGEELYVIVSGSVRVFRRGLTVATLGAGDFFGEMALMARAPRAATVTAEVDTRLVILSPQRFRVVLEREPSVALSIMRVMSERIQQLEKSFTH